MEPPRRSLSTAPGAFRPVVWLHSGFAATGNPGQYPQSPIPLPRKPELRILSRVSSSARQRQDDRGDRWVSGEPRGSTSDSDSRVVDDHEFPGQTQMCEASDRLTQSGIDGLLGRGMQSKAQDTRRRGGWITEHIREVAVEGDENPTALYGCGAHRLVPQVTQGSYMQWGEVLVQQELHASASTTSSAASAAAYSRHARKSSSVRCG
jgi:hypothetical protein